MRVLALALKDWLQVARDWKSALFLVLMPVVFTGFLGLMVGGDATEDPRWPVGVVDQDHSGGLGSALADLINASAALRPVTLSPARAQRADDLVRRGELAAVLVVPDGFSHRALVEEEARLTLIVDETSQTGQSVHSTLEGLIVRLLGCVEAARLSTERFATARGFADENARWAYMNEGLERALADWSQPPLSVRVEMAGAGAAEVSGGSSNPFTQSSPGMIVQFVIFGLMTSGSVLVLERKSRALQRMLTTPISRGEIIGGHVLAMFAIVFVQQALLVGAGQLLFGVNYMRQPLGTLLMIGTFALFAAAFGLFVGAIAKGEEQVILWSLIAMFVLTALGGAWFPLDATGKVFAAIGHLTPTAWVMEGFQNIVLRNQGLSSVLVPAGVVAAYAVAFFVLAVWRFRFE